MTEHAVAEGGGAPPASQRVIAREPVLGRLAVISGMSLMVGAIPIPFLPDRLVKQLRGAVVHEVVSRHGLSLSGDARDTLASTSTDKGMRKLLRKGMHFMLKRVIKRMGPLAPLGAAASAVEVYALGHLLDRYLERVRRRGTVRVQQPEALRVRRAIDRATLRAFHPETVARPLLLRQGAEDLRDEFTRWVDTLLLSGATMPSYFIRRLEAAFDVVVGESPELIDESE
jgi:uncharacterized protein (DUF697 family)